MEANARNLERIFDSTVSYQVPLFQRPYVWNEQDNWEPLWEDIHSLLDRQLHQGRSRTHFLGAVVLEQFNHASGSIESRQIIDGQQRFTTLQLFMIAARDISKQAGSEKYYERFNDMVCNKANKVDHAFEMYKIWPTNCDRSAFVEVHKSGSIAALDQAIKDQPEIASQNRQVIDGYCYFFTRLSTWLDGNLDDEDQVVHPQSFEDRLDVLWQVVRDALKLVVIDLGNDDESQVIFETLNARGTQLLPADLVKNYLFRKAQNDGQNVEALYEEFWKDFDSSFWREEEKQGRLKRPRIDLFFQHYLALMIQEDIRTTHLFETFKYYVEELELEHLEGASGKASLTKHPVDIREHLQALSRYAKIFESFRKAEEGSRLALFMERLNAVDTATVYPLLLLASNTLLPDQQDELDRFLTVLESFLMRRMICCLTTKNYNQLFLSAIRALDRQGEVTAAGLAKFLKSNKGDSVRFPDDDEFDAAIKLNPLYLWLAQYKVRAILEALDLALYERKSEQVPLPNNLTIEHVLPVKWQEHWPISEQTAQDPVSKLQFTEQRDRALHSLGNLTLITNSLNPSLSNGAWRSKRSELAKFSKLNLNRYFHNPSDPDARDPLEEWNEATIAMRAQELSGVARGIWPY